MSDTVYIIGHKSPDLDTVASAVSYAYLKNYLENTNIYEPAVPSEVNKETKYIFEKFNINIPPVLKSAKDQNIILVDHNEASQSVDGIEGANILGILDHHKVNFTNSNVIEFNIKPWGSSCTIVAQEFFNNNVDIDRDLAAMMLAAILVDTVITKSPTSTEKDLEVIEKLATMANVENWKEFGMEIFKVRSDLSALSEKEIIKSDFKDFEFTNAKFGIGQVETADLSQFTEREDALLEEMKKLKEEAGYHSVILFITDIIKEGSQFLVISDEIEKIEESFNAKFNDNKNFLPGIMSRKKQVAPCLTEMFD